MRGCARASGRRLANSLGAMSKTPPDRQFWDVADSFIIGANEHPSPLPEERLAPHCCTRRPDSMHSSWRQIPMTRHHFERRERKPFNISPRSSRRCLPRTWMTGPITMSNTKGYTQSWRLTRRSTRTSRMRGLTPDAAGRRLANFVRRPTNVRRANPTLILVPTRGHGYRCCRARLASALTILTGHEFSRLRCPSVQLGNRRSDYCIYRRNRNFVSHWRLNGASGRSICLWPSRFRGWRHRRCWSCPIIQHGA